MPEDLWECFEKGILIAHNAGFELAITRYCLPRYRTLRASQSRILVEGIPLSRWRCTAAKAAACSLPRSLEMVCKALSLPIQKDMEGNRLMKKYMKPRKPSKNNPKVWWDDKDELRRIYRYCLIDVEAEYLVDEALPDLSPDEQKVWELDQKINQRGIRIDIPTVKLILAMIKEESRNITKEVQRLSNGVIGLATQVAKVLEWVNDLGADMENLQAPTIRDKLLEKDLHPKIREMLEYRQNSSRTSTGKYISMLHAVGEDHRARELLLYAGTAPTMRWSGKRVQPQNFPRPTIKDFDSDKAIEAIKSGGIEAIRAKYGKSKVMDVLASSTRGMLIPSDGNEFFCCDWSNIEARMAFWLAEHEEGLEAFRQKRKIYEEMAASAFKIPIATITKDSLERFVGKESVLGCQYGMGWKKFMDNCHKKGVSQVTADMAKKAVYSYRALHHPIPTLWKNLEIATIDAILHPGKVNKLNKVAIYVKNDFLHIKLPSGGKLRYYKPRVCNKRLESGRIVPEIRYWAMDNHKWCEVVTWGGILTNHIVQRLSRDLMVNSIQNIEEAGYMFVLSVHDEGLSERKIGEGSVEEYTRLFAELPVWAEGAPLEAVGWSGMRYKKG
jgi:DNA polymerase